MKKIRINVEFDGRVISSDPIECDKEEEVKLKKLATMAADGKLDSLHITRGKKISYIPSQILAKSIISLTYETADKK